MAKRTAENESEARKRRLPNPFTPTFGSIPVSLAGRGEIIEDVLEGLGNAPGDPNRTTVFVGARGTGKTALLAYLAEKAEQAGFVSVNVSCGDDLLEEVYEQVVEKADAFIVREADSRIVEARVGAVAVARQIDEKPTKSWRSRMTSVLKQLDEAGVGLLITVDEVNPRHDSLKKLVDVYQHFVRERRNIALLMAGLPSNVSLLLRDDDISFFRRAFQHRMEAIPLNEVELALQETIETAGRSISRKALEMAAASTDGFAFMVQLVGYYAWRQHPAEGKITKEDVEAAIAQAKRDMERLVFESTLRDLSPKDLAFLRAMADDEGDSLISDVALRMGVDASYARHYKQRLVEQGIVGAVARGKVAFEIPGLRVYLRKTAEIARLT